MKWEDQRQSENVEARRGEGVVVGVASAVVAAGESAGAGWASAASPSRWSPAGSLASTR